MRSRYAAFALGLGAYLVSTLAASHPDRTLPRQELERSLFFAKQRQRYNGLRILEVTSDGERGEVLFFARIFERGHDQSFAELSDFVREGTAWRYAAGIALPKARLPEDLDGLTRASFLALAESAQ
jgi:SEC-C motif-containing protein